MEQLVSILSGRRGYPRARTILTLVGPSEEINSYSNVKEKHVIQSLIEGQQQSPSSSIMVNGITNRKGTGDGRDSQRRYGKGDPSGYGEAAMRVSNEISARLASIREKDDPVLAW